MKHFLNEYKIYKSCQPCWMYIPAWNLCYRSVNTDEIVYIIKQKVEHQFLFFTWYTYRKVKVFDKTYDGSSHFINDYGYTTLYECNNAIEKLKNKQLICIG